LLALAWLVAMAPPEATAQAAPTEPSHPQGSYQALPGGRIWVESEGEGMPLLLIAGGPGMAHDYFHPYFSALSSPTRRVIYFDAFGRGKSDRAAKATAYTFTRDVEEVEALRKALGITKMDVLGHSYGTLVAQAYALKYPQAVSRLILISPLNSGAAWQASNDLINGQIEKTMPDDWKKLQGLRAQGLRSSSLEHSKAYRTPPGLYFHRPPGRPLPLGVNSDVYYAIAGDDADFVIGGEIAQLDFRPQLKSLAAPLLVLAGRHDRIALPDRVAEYKTQAPRAEVVTFEQSAHFPFIEETDAVIERIRKFLAE
jgi:proline iminopeptidase